MSHPTWVRGLKPQRRDMFNEARWVAPYVGAWIETALSKVQDSLIESHPTWVRGLKHLL